MSFAVRQNRNNRIVFREVRDINNRIDEMLRQGFINYMQALKLRANKAILAKDKTGKVYIVRTPGGRRRRHTSSAPGQTHANRSGTLRKSLSWKVQGFQRARFGYGVSTTAANAAPNYAGFVDRGTRNMEPRPSIDNAIEDEPLQIHWDRAFDQEFGF